MSRNGRRVVLSAVVSVVGLVASQQRADATVVYTWIGSGSGDWSTPANWGGGLLPVSASSTWLRYVIPAGSASVVSNNDLASPFDLNVLWITNNASTAHTIQGAPLRFDTNFTQQETIQITTPSGTLTYGGVTIANDMILTRDLLVSGSRFPTVLTGQISGPGHLSATSAGTFILNHANTYTGGTNIAFSHLWVTGSGNLGTGSTQIGDEQVTLNWFGLAKFDSAANVASGAQSVYVGGNGFVQFLQLDQNAVNRINPSSHGMLVIDNATVVAPTLDLSNYPSLRLGAHMPGITAGSVTLSSTIIPANNTYRFGGQDSGGTTPYDEDTLNVTSPLTDGLSAPRSVNIGPGLTGLGGKVKLSNTSNSYTGGTVIEHGPLFFDLNAGLTFDYKPAAGQTPLGTGSVQVGGSLIFEGSFGGVGALPNSIVFKPGSKLLFNNVLPGGGSLNVAANADRWGDDKPLDLNGTELTLRAVGSHTEIVGATTYADDDHLLIERTGPGGSFTPSGTTTFQTTSLTRAGRATMTIAGVGANTFGQTHRVAITNPTNLIDAATGMIHPSIVGDRPGDAIANPGEFLALGPGNVLVPSAYTTSLGSGSDSEIASVAMGGINFSYGFEETLWALRAGSASTTFSSGLHVRSGGLILAGTLGGTTVSFDDHGAPVEGLIYVPESYNTSTIGTGTINSTIATTAGITKFGGGSLTLNAANTFTGGLNINDGWLRLGTAGAAAINNNPVFIGENGTLDLFGKSITLSALSGDGAITSVFSGTTTLTLDTSGGDMQFDGRIQGTSSRIIALNKVGPNTLKLGGYNRYHGLTTVSAGTLELAGRNVGVLIPGTPSTLNYGDYTTAAGAALRVSADNRIGALSGGGDTHVANGAQITAASIRQNLLDVGIGARAVVLRNGGDAGTSRLNGLTFGGAGTFLGQLDLGDNDLVLDYSTSSPIGAVANMIKSGYAGGAWTGNGIASSAARDAATNAASRSAALGYAEAAQVFSSFPATFSGQSVDNTTVLVRYTLSGDSNIDGSVDLTDFTFLAANFNGTNKGWLQGDYNYDGTVDLTDFTFLAANFNQTLAAGGSSPGSPVPEPALLTPLALVLACGAARSRRRIPMRPIV